jgi:subtilase family serine protease
LALEFYKKIFRSCLTTNEEVCNSSFIIYRACHNSSLDEHKGNRRRGVKMKSWPLGCLFLLVLFSLNAIATDLATPLRHRPACPNSGNGNKARCFLHYLIDDAGDPFHPMPVDDEHDPSIAATVGYVPGQIRHAYGIDALSRTNNGAGKTIALVEAYDAPTLANDLAVFKQQFGITGCSLTKVNQTGGSSLPAPNASWALEASMDVEWACAIAPGANLLVVEANSNSTSDLLIATQYAATHADVVSMSWGGAENVGELISDSIFNVSGVSFFASSGDGGHGVIYPAASPYVVAVGGTTLLLNSIGNLTGPETAWSGSGGGISLFELEPLYQSLFPIPITGGFRGAPDVSFDGNPNTGVYVYDSTPVAPGQVGWFIVGGTSLGAPAWAALTALVDQLRSSNLSSNDLLNSPQYNAAANNVLFAANYRDITSGTNGTCGSFCTAVAGWDFVTGLGSPKANALVPYLQTH